MPIYIQYKLHEIPCIGYRVMTEDVEMDGLKNQAFGRG